MITKEIMINNEIGLHARPASLFSKMALDAKSDIKIVFKDNEINAKSIMAILSAGISGGSTITVIADGDDECEVMDKLNALVESNFEA